MQAAGPEMSGPTTPVDWLKITPGQASRIACAISRGDLGSQAGQVPLPGRLLPEMHVHDRGAGIERRAGLARHLLGRDGHVVLRGIGEHARERAGDDRLRHQAPRS